MGERTTPIAGIALALLTGVVLLVAGVSVWLVLPLALVWIGSLWLHAPPPLPPRVAEAEGVKLSRAGMSEVIEHSGLPVLMLDGLRIIAANASAREVLGAHVLGQDARVALRHPDAVELLAQQGRSSATIQGLTGPRSVWQLTRQPVDERYAMIEMVNRAAEADVSRAHTDFVANASHELRTPLASIIGYVETLAEKGATIEPRQAERFYAIVLREARRLQSLVDDLLSLSRIEAEKHDHPTEPVELAALVQQAARDGAGPERQQRLVFELASAPHLVRGDARQLEQLVRNLVDNALKYGAADGPVTVSLARGARGQTVLTVADQGEGIAAEHLPHLTRRFYRTDPGRSRAAGGTGLGLAIVKHIVERHRGRLDISSAAGRGTCVTVQFPALECQPGDLS